MTYIRAIAVALAFLIGFSPAIAAPPPPVPALPDTARITTYTPTASTGPFSVGFDLYGDSTDYGDWLEVWLNGKKLTPVTDWQLTSATGQIANIPRPITDGAITLTNAATGTMYVVGARRPRRPSVFIEGRGVPARDFNQILNDLTAQNREAWDARGRTLRGAPGVVYGQIPTNCNNSTLGFDSTGLNPVCTPAQPPVHYIAAAVLATAAVLPNTPTYANGTAGVGATLTAGSNGALTVDGIAVSSGNRILVKNQAAPAQNGVYTVTTVGSGGAPYVLTRVTDFDTPSEQVQGSALFITNGTANGGTGWVLSNTVASVGTDSATFYQFYSASTSVVTSFNGRINAVVPAANDYSAGQISYTGPGANASATNLGSRNTNGALNFVSDYGADPTGATNNAPHLIAAIADSLATGHCLFIPKGTYTIAAQVAVNMHNYLSQGICIYGEGRGNPNGSILNFATTATPAFYLFANDHDGIVNGRIENLAILGNTIGPTFQIGKDNLLDAFNEMQLLNLFIANGNTSSTAIALKLNFFLNGSVEAIINGGGYNVATRIGSGFAALDCNQCIFNKFFGSFGISNVGTLLRNGSNYGNAFIAIDSEANTTSILINNAQSFNNTWYNGSITLGLNGIEAHAGAANVLSNVNFNNVTNKVTASVGLWCKTPFDNFVVTPAFPASGGTVTNTTCQTAFVAMNAAFTSVAKNGAAIFSSGGSFSVILEPGDTITPSYTGGGGWSWTPMR
jgi:hypothetical protein